MTDHFWRFVPELKSYLSKRLESTEIDDVVQDVMLRIHARDGDWDVQFPKRYLYRVARSALVDLYRRNQTRCAHHHCELSPETHPRDDISPIRILQAREDMQAAREAMKLLPQRTCDILLAVRVDGQSLKAVAAAYGISTSAVEKHLSRALDVLTTHLLDADERRAFNQGSQRTRRFPLAAA